MASPHRKRHGAKTAALAAEWFRKHGWPFATDTGAGRPGRDIENMPGMAPEVKGRRDYNPTGWLRQAKANAGGDLAFVVHRPDGYGPARLPDWPVTLRLEDFTQLARQAGYGDPAEETPQP